MRNNKHSDKPYQYSEDTLRLTGFASMHFELKLGKVTENEYQMFPIHSSVTYFVELWLL